jgi:hypothetical protein
MLRRRIQGSAAGVVVLMFLAACGGAPKAPAETAAATPPAAPEPQAHAANDPAQPPPPAVAAPPARDEFDPATAAGAVKGVPAPTNSASIEAVANYFTDLPGLDMSGLSDQQRQHLLHRVNSELCTCGCKHETLAFCFVNDPRCPKVKGLVNTVLNDIKAGK